MIVDPGSNLLTATRLRCLSSAPPRVAHAPIALSTWVSPAQGYPSNMELSKARAGPLGYGPDFQIGVHFPSGLDHVIQPVNLLVYVAVLLGNSAAQIKRHL